MVSSKNSWPLFNYPRGSKRCWVVFGEIHNSHIPEKHCATHFRKRPPTFLDDVLMCTSCLSDRRDIPVDMQGVHCHEQNVLVQGSHHLRKN